MNLVKTSLLSGLAVATRLSTALYLNKMLAVYVGPAGFALVGQFQSLISLVQAFGGGALQVGVTKYTAEYATNVSRRQTVHACALAVSLLSSVAVAVVLVLGREALSVRIFGTDAYADVVVWLAATLVFISTNAIVLAILNGAKQIRSLTAANIGGSLLTAALSTALVVHWHVHGALIALAAGPAAALLVSLYFFRRVERFHWPGWQASLDKDILRKLGGYALMAGTTALVVPVGFMIIRDSLASQMGWSGAGLWQALWKISETHLLLLTSVLSVYFLPRLAEIRKGDELRREVLGAYRFVVPIVLLSAIALYLFREVLIRTLLSPEFAPIGDVFPIQLVGDMLKICSWVMAYTMVSHAQTRSFIVTEILFTALLVGATIVLTRWLGLTGAALAYAGTYLLYWMTVYVLFRRLVTHLDSPPSETLRQLSSRA